MALDATACPTNYEVIHSSTYSSASLFPVNFTPKRINLLYKTGNANNNIPIDYVEYDWIMFVFVTTTELGYLTLDSQYTSSSSRISIKAASGDSPSLYIIINNNGKIIWKDLG